MTKEQWVERAKDQAVWDIGQLDAATKRALDRAAKRGEVMKSRLCWCNIGHPRSVWHPTA